MHSVELLEQALRAARKLGYGVREEWLGGTGGGDCVLHGKKVLFLDLAQGPTDQLGQVVEALRREPRTSELKLPPELQTLLGGSRPAAPR